MKRWAKGAIEGLNGDATQRHPGTSGSPANVADAATELPNSLVIAATQAHTFGHVGCMPNVVTAFIEAGTVKGLDTTCADGLPAPPFAPSPG